MTIQSRDRLFSPAHAFDHPVVLWTTVGIAGVLILAIAATLVMSRLNLIDGKLRSELVRRILSWAVIAPLVIGPVLLGAGYAIVLVAIMSILSYREFARATGLFREKTMSAMVVLGILLLTFAALDHWYGLFVAITPLTIMLMLAAGILRDEPKGYVQRVGLAVLAFALFGTCFLHLAYFANDANFRALILLLLISVAMNDVFAFIVGKSVGGPKLAPNTSPNKTIAGSIGALILTTALFALIGHFVFKGSILDRAHHLILMGMLLSVAGQFGDLTISLVKRDVGIKDTGNLIPGHGGVLDRCNSLLLSAPALFHYVGYFVGIGWNQTERIVTG
jgi:phosphatidate cytidylyltransferase